MRYFGFVGNSDQYAYTPLYVKCTASGRQNLLSWIWFEAYNYVGVFALEPFRYTKLDIYAQYNDDTEVVVVLCYGGVF